MLYHIVPDIYIHFPREREREIDEECQTAEMTVKFVAQLYDGIGYCQVVGGFQSGH